MTKKVIQIPIDQHLLEALDAAASKRRQSRSELIRTACQTYLRWEERKQMDEAYEEAYRRLPESPVIGEVQITLVNQMLPEEPW